MPASLALGFLLILVAGCRTDRDRPPSDSVEPPRTALAGVDPCALVTTGEVEDALDGPLIEQERPIDANLEPYLVTCRFISESGASIAVMTVMLRASEAPGEARIGFGTAREAFMPWEPVSGVGDDAFWSGDQLTVLAGDLVLTISGDVAFEDARRLARSILERLE